MSEPQLSPNRYPSSQCCLPDLEREWPLAVDLAADAFSVESKSATQDLALLASTCKYVRTFALIVSEQAKGNRSAAILNWAICMCRNRECQPHTVVMACPEDMLRGKSMRGPPAAPHLAPLSVGTNRSCAARNSQDNDTLLVACYSKDDVERRGPDRAQPVDGEGLCYEHIQSYSRWLRVCAERAMSAASCRIAVNSGAS